jgi:hypothetical protein
MLSKQMLEDIFTNEVEETDHAVRLTIGNYVHINQTDLSHLKGFGISFKSQNSAIYIHTGVIGDHAVRRYPTKCRNIDLPIVSERVSCPTPSD